MKTHVRLLTRYWSLLLLAVLVPLSALAGTVTTIKDYGTLDNKRFYYPQGISVDANGVIVVTDTNNHALKGFTEDGKPAFSIGSSGTGAGQFSYPQAVTRDKLGNLWVVDTNNHRVQKFDQDGNFADVAAGTLGNAHSGDYRLGNPYDIKVGPDGNYWIADYGKHRIVALDKAGHQVRLIGEYGTNDGQFNNPNGVDFAGDGNLWVADRSNHRLQKFAQDGTFKGKIGGYGSASGDGKSLYNPKEVCPLADGVLVAYGQRVIKFNLNGLPVFILGKADGSSGTGNGEFNEPRGIAVDGSGNIYVADRNNDRIQKFTASGAFSGIVVSGYAGGASDKYWDFDLGDIYHPIDVAIDAAGLLVVLNEGYGNKGVVQKFTTTTIPGAYVSGFDGSTDLSGGVISYPEAMTIDGSGDIWLVEDSSHRVRHFDADGIHLQTITTLTINDQATTFKDPRGIVVNGNTVWVSDNNNGRVLAFDKQGGSAQEFTGFYNPWGLAKDSAGELWIADYNNHRVMQMSASGLVKRAFSESASLETIFSNPAAVTADGSGGLWVSDRGNKRVLRYDASGTLLLKIGGYNSGVFNDPEKIAVAADGSIWVADYNGQAVRHFSADGIALGKIDNTTQNGVVLNGPTGVALYQDQDQNEFIVVTDRDAHQVVKFTAAGSFVGNLGLVGYGSGLNQFYTPAAVAVSGQELLVADYNNTRIKVLTLAGGFKRAYTTIGSDAELLNYPSGVAFNAKDNTIWVVDQSNDRLMVLDQDGKFIRTVDGPNSGLFYTPTDIYADSNGHLFVADDNTDQVVELDGEGNLVQILGGEKNGNSFGQPAAALGLADGSVWVTDTNNHRVGHFKGDGTLIVMLGGQEGNADGQFKSPQGLAVSNDGNSIYVADTDNDRIQQFSKEGVFQKKVGKSGGGPGADYVDNPAGMAVDSQGRLWVAERINHRLHAFDASGATLFTKGSSALFNSPSAVAIDKSGKVWVTDTNNHRVMKFEPDNSTTPLLTLGKTGKAAGSEAGEFSSPAGIAVDSEGHIQVADNNNRIQVFKDDGTFLRAYGGLNYPKGISISEGKVFVADGNNNRVALYLESGAFVKSFEDNGVAEDGFNNPHGVAKDSAGNLWVADFDNDRVVRLDSAGKVVQKIVEMLDGPDGLSIDGDDNLWVTSRNRHLVLKFSKTGALLKAFDNSGVAFANINDPSDMKFFQGNLYLVDRYNHRVVVQDASGATVRTFGALGDSAGLLHEPWGITVGPDNNIWVSQTYDEKITVFTPSGDFVKTFGSYGSLNGMLNDPHGIAFGLDGNLWVVNSSSSRLDLFSQSGAYLKSVASQGLEHGKLNGPQGIVIDSQGRLFVGDTGNHRISVFDKDGNYLYVFGSSDLSSPMSPMGMAIDSQGLLWVIDSSNRKLLAFDLSGQLLFTGGENGDGVGMFKDPSALAVDAAGKVWVGDNSKDNLQGFELSQPQNLALQLLHRHWRYGAEAQHIVDVPVGGLIHPQVTGSVTLGDTSGTGDLKSILPTTWVSTNPDVATVDTNGTITAQAAGQAEVQATISNQTLAMTVNVKADNALPVMVLGSQGGAFGEYNSPGPIWSGNGKVYVADSSNQRVTVLDLTGNWLQTIRASGNLNNIGGLVADANGGLFVSDANNHKIHKFDASGNLLLSFGEYGTANGQLNSPQGLSLDSNGNLWVAEQSNHRVQAFTPAGVHLGGFGTYGWEDGQLYSPSSVVVDGAGNVWVADYYHLKKFTTNGTFLAKFDSIYPRRLTLDGDGALWVLCSDSYIRKFGSDLKQLMDYYSTTSEDEPGKFYNLEGIAVDAAGNLWVSEYSNHRLQRIDFIPQQLNLLAAKTVVKDEEQVDAIAIYGVTDTVKPSEIVNSAALWSVNDQAMATVESGLLTALKTGPVQVTAQYSGLSASMPLNLLATFSVEEAGNVDQANAQSLNVGEAMEGSMTGNKYEDHWFSLSPTTSGYYRILYASIANQNYNTSLTIYDSQQDDPLHTISPLPTSGLTVPIFLDQQKSYYMKISGYYQDTFLLSYIFVVAGEPPSPSQSVTVNLGEPVSGQVAVGSSNYYKLVLSGPRQLLFSYENPGSVTDMQITVYPEEVSADTVLDRATSTAGETKEIAIGLNQGTYYIEMKANGNIDESTYTLTVAPNLQVGAGEYEGNNTKGFANSLADGVALTARNYSPQDVDLYTFHYAPAPSSDWLIFNFTPKDANGYHTIRLLNLEGDDMQKTFTSSSGQVLTNQKINMKPGQYFLEVKDSYDKRTEYTLSLAGKINKISSAKKVTGVELIPAKAIADIKVGDTVAILAKVYYSDGSVVENPEAATWTGTNQEVIAVSPGQLVVAKKGAGSLVVSFEGKVATIDLDFSAVGVVKKQGYGNLIIVAGGGIEAGNKLKDITQYLSDLSYQKFKGRGFGDEDILYLNPKAFKDLDGNGFNDGIVDQTEITKAGFAQAISGWATEYPSTGPLYIYLNDHGADAQFQLYPSQVLTAAELKKALDDFQTATGRAVVVIIEACHSGTFVAPLMANGATNRVVITSSDTGLAFLGDGGSASFSQFFMGSLYKGASLSEAFTDANTALTALGKPYTGMYPQVAPASLAGSAQDFFVVGNFALAPMFPEINQTTLATTYDTTVGGGYSLQAKVTGVSNGKVWATIKPADYTPPAVSGEFATPDIQLPMVELSDADQDGVMDGTFDGAYSAFTANGVYDVVIFARDAEGNITQTPVHKLTVSGLTSSNAYLNVGLSWGLLSSTVPVQVGTVFADKEKFVSVWKWENDSWSVYLPGEANPGSYATSKSFGNLATATINPGEGFWVNSKVEQQLILTGTPVLDGTMTILPGWNLLGLKSDQPISAAEIANAPQSGIVSMWKWVVSGGQVKWAVYLTKEGGSQGSYAGSKGFEVLSTIDPGEGFWVNKQ